MRPHRWFALGAICLVGCVEDVARNAGDSAGSGSASTANSPRRPATAKVVLGDGDLLILSPAPTLPEHGLPIYAAVYADEGRRIVTLGGDGRLKVADAATGALQRNIELEGIEPSMVTTRLAAAPGGPLVAVALLEQILLYDTATGRRVAQTQLEGERLLQGLAFDATGERLVAVGAKNGYLLGLDGKTLRSWPTETRDAFALTPDGQSIIYASAENTLDSYDLETGERTARREGLRAAPSMPAINPAGTLLAMLQGEEVVVYGLHPWGERAVVDGKTARRIYFAPDGTLVVAGGNFHYYRIGAQGAEQLTVVIPDGSIRADNLSFSPDGVRMLAVGTQETRARQYRLDRSQELRTLASTADAPLVALAVSRNGRYLAWADAGAVKLYSTAEQKVIRTAALPALDRDARLEFSYESDLLLYRTTAASHKGLTVYATPSLDVRHTLDAKRRSFADACFIPGGTDVLLVESDGSHLWNLASDELTSDQLPLAASRVQTVPGVEERVFSIDSRNQAAVYLWPDAQELHRGPTEQIVGGFAVSPEGRLMATFGQTDRRLLIWDTESLQLVREIPLEAGVTAAAFSSDGNWLLTSGFQERTLKVRSCEDWSLQAECPAHDSHAAAIVFIYKTPRFYTLGGISDRSSIKEWDLEKLLERVPAPPPQARPTSPGPSASGFGSQ